ncbi:transport protein Trs120 or TRAPPC9 TRAPP II complex subunit-domain-containing protein [Diplogelasinospora grovesii]|uniref:p-aminobenzoic acid synthase n=1 Tax=Diplogelasinospora grovesii TaxID=303347 RepID=A0AAN6NJ86_9PEZI|nr:transport protein Trs120 or TRAPPC9 TRAPP II complex subunit-domain-containing protein [Diplogelasinospora grovesii]
MSLDPLSPIAPARVKALVVPIGRIKRERFTTFVDRLNGEHVVHLGDISPDGRPNRNMFSPLAFPGGAMFYELMTHLPPPSHIALSPFDLYREPLVLIAVADGSELGNGVFSKRQSGGRTVEETNIRGLYQELEDLRDTHPKILVHQLLIFDYVASKEHPVSIPEGITTIPPAEKLKRTTMKTVMCDISSMLLAEMTTLAKSFEGMSYIDSPGQSSTIRQLNGAMSGGDESNGLARRNSQFALPTGTRSASASALADRSHVRMSMPPVPSRGTPLGSSSSTPARPSTPVNTRSGLSNPPTTFEDITGGENLSSDPTSPEQQTSSRPGTAEGFRTQSQDRVSVQGFGPGGLNERWRLKGKSRVQIVVGSLYLQAGRWSDAIRELSEGAAAAKSINDHLWHGKALELTVISLLLLGWAGIEFQVPIVLLPPADKNSGVAAAIQEAENRNPSQPRWLRNLQVYMPELLERTLALYSRISAEHLPPLPLSEATIRFCRILTALHVADGELGSKALEMIVYGKTPETPLTTSPRLNIIPTRTQIVTALLRAFPPSGSELLTTTDRIVILSGIASVLGVLGFQRKKAMVIRELVSVLIGGLVEARTRGAADVGIHPAAGLAALNGGMNGQSNGGAALDLSEGDIEHGIDAFLGLLLKTYGIVGSDMSLAATTTSDTPKTDDESDEALVSRIQKQSTVRFFGMQSVKLNILRACINFSEALPDFGGVLRFSSDLLRTAGSGIAPGPQREVAWPAITREEQVRLVANIKKTSSLSKRLGFSHLAAEFWDEFLLRGVKLEPLPVARTPIPHAKSALPDAAKARTSQDVDPFIYNPFLKQPETVADKILVAGEKASFRLTLQNTYEIDLDIESVRLESEGAEFESAVASTLIGPYRTHVLRVTGVPKSAGTLKITGAIIKIRGCRERRFAIFPKPWAPENEMKVKAIGLGALDKHLAQPTPATQPLTPESVEFNVIAPQPVVVVKSSTLPQSSVMILEGERQTFSVTLQNLSATTPVDFLLFSFQDSTQEPLQTALNSRDATPAELYEYELILAKKQALRIRTRGNGQDRRFIAPGGTSTFDFEILGKPGLTNGLISIDYARLGVPHDQVEDRFYTRQVSQELTITVNASVEVARWDVLPLHGSIPEPLWGRRGGHIERGVITGDEYCLLLLDLRNAWPSHMHVELEASDGARIEENILPGNTSRVVLPLKRVYLEDPHAFIPALNPSRQRQFVVSTHKISPDVERANREAFWYREKILETLKGRWKTTASVAGARIGSIELRNIRLTSRMIEAIKIDEVDIQISVDDPSSSRSGSGAGSGAEGGVDDGRGNVAFVDEFFNLRVKVTNRTDQPIYPLVRVMPALCHRPLNVALDFTRKFAWNGTLQQVLPMLGAKETTEVTQGITALCRGEFELTASVEETRVWKPVTEEDKRKSSAGAKNRPRSETETLMDAVLGAKERRIWHSRRPCLVTPLEMARAKILFLDAYDSFSNNIASLLTTLLGVDVFVLPIDSLLHPPTTSDEKNGTVGGAKNGTSNGREFHNRLREELRHYDAVVCGPGPGHPDNRKDVGLMHHIWQLEEEDVLPVLGICLGFQSLVKSSGGKVVRLKRGLHGMVRPIIPKRGTFREGAAEIKMGEGEDIFQGVQPFKATLYHSLCAKYGNYVHSGYPGSSIQWVSTTYHSDVVPLAWVLEERDGGEVEKILMGVKHKTLPFWGVQYHPESVCTEREGDQVIVNWFRAALKWNATRGRRAVEGTGLARQATRPSLLSQLSLPGRVTSKENFSREHRGGSLGGSTVPDIVDALGEESSKERIILDSANAAIPNASADVRGRYSIIALDLEHALQIKYRAGADFVAFENEKVREEVSLGAYGNSIWKFLASFHSARQLEPTADESPFVGGFMGYITYEQGLHDLGIPLTRDQFHHDEARGKAEKRRARQRTLRPDICFAWVTRSLVVDHATRVVHVQQLRSPHEFLNTGDGMDWVEKTAARLSTLQHRPSTEKGRQSECETSIQIEIPQPAYYEDNVQMCQEYIAAGESYELCLTDQTIIKRPRSNFHMPPITPKQQRRRQDYAEPSGTGVSSSWQLFKTLRARQPAPFASYIRLGGATLVSASPERFLQYSSDGLCSMRPMKGTVRKSEAVKTLDQAEKILHVPKEEAENLMIVDLVRHDLHGICGAGNVRVPDLLKVEEYQSVFQMITIVEGQLPKPAKGEKGYTGLDALAASLPPGSMTGAPKKRSCEILQNIEGHGGERSLYSGVVGYMCVTGKGDWSVTIRSMFRWDDENDNDGGVATLSDEVDGTLPTETWHIGAGGAVTILSTPKGEREEMFTKLAGPLSVFTEPDKK